MAAGVEEVARTKGLGAAHRFECRGPGLDPEFALEDGEGMDVVGMAVGEKEGDYVEVEGGHGLKEWSGIRPGIEDGRIAVLLVPEKVGVHRHGAIVSGGLDHGEGAFNLRPVTAACQPDESVAIELENGGEGAGRRFVKVPAKEAVHLGLGQAGRFGGRGGGETSPAQSLSENVGEVVFQRGHSCCDFNCWRRTKYKA